MSVRIISTTVLQCIRCGGSISIRKDPDGTWTCCMQCALSTEYRPRPRQGPHQTTPDRTTQHRVPVAA